MTCEMGTLLFLEYPQTIILNNATVWQLSKAKLPQFLQSHIQWSFKETKPIYKVHHIYTKTLSDINQFDAIENFFLNSTGTEKGLIATSTCVTILIVLLLIKCYCPNCFTIFVTDPCSRLSAALSCKKKEKNETETGKVPPTEEEP